MGARGPAGERRTARRPRPASASRPAARPPARPGAGRRPATPTTPTTPTAIAPRRSLRLAVLASLAVILTVLLAPTLHAYLAQRSQISELRATVAQQKKDVAALDKEQARWKDDAYVVQQARERLKFVKVGEKSYTVVDADPGVSTDGNLASAPASSNDHPWYGRLWESVAVADAPAAHP